MPEVKAKTNRQRKPKVEERDTDHSVEFGGWDMFGVEVPTNSTQANVYGGLTHTPIRRAIHILSSYVAKLPLSVYSRDDSGDTIEATDHAAWWLLKRKPSAYYTPFTFFYSLMLNALWCGRGNGYAYIYRDGAGRPSELLLIDSSDVEPVRSGGVVYYNTIIEPAGSDIKNPRRVPVPAGDMLHIRSLTLDGITGLDVVNYNRDATKLGLALRQHGIDFFQNGAVPGVVLQRPPEAGKLSIQAEEALRRRFDTTHAGAGRHHRTAVLQEGTEAKTVAVDAQKSQLIEQRKFDILEVANLFGVPPHKLGATDRTSYASLEQENQAFLDDGLDPWLAQIEQECSDKLLSESERKSGYYCEYNREALMRVNTSDKFAALNIAVQGGIMSRDEVRRKLNLNKIPGGLGDVFYGPLNMAPLGKEDDTQDDSEDANDSGDAPPVSMPGDMPADSEASRAFIADVADRIRRRMARVVESVTNRRGFVRLIQSMGIKHTGFFDSVLTPFFSDPATRITAARSLTIQIGDDLLAIQRQDGDYKANLTAWAAGDSILKHLQTLLGVETNGTSKTTE